LSYCTHPKHLRYSILEGAIILTIAHKDHPWIWVPTHGIQIPVNHGTVPLAIPIRILPAVITHGLDNRLLLPRLEPPPGREPPPSEPPPGREPPTVEAPSAQEPHARQPPATTTSALTTPKVALIVIGGPWCPINKDN
jgi:hypothetical protein